MITEERVMIALREHAIHDSSEPVRKAARAVLISRLAGEPPLAPDQPPSASKKYMLFFGGLLGWYLANGVFWFFNYNPTPGAFLGNAGYFLLSGPANLLILITLAVIKRTRLVALGILTALGLNFLLSLINGLFYNGICFFPFYLK
jgi:hypothetical protein